MTVGGRADPDRSESFGEELLGLLLDGAHELPPHLIGPFPGGVDDCRGVRRWVPRSPARGRRTTIRPAAVDLTPLLANAG
ncbi:hypothetical protein STANM337S_07122 [Streptomyces tanashiensis]